MYSGKEAPKSSQVPELILNFCKDAAMRLKHLPNRNDDKFPLAVIELLVWFQHRFVMIHPFQDYNGRIARMLTVFLLLKLQLPPAEIKVENENDRKRYVRAMREADDGDYLLLKELLTNTIVESFEKNL